MNKRLLRNFVLMRPEGDGASGGASTPASADSGSAAAGAAAGAGAGAGAGAAASQDSAPAFVDSLGDAELKAYVENKGYKSPADAVKALRDAETSLARPETADDYELPVPDGQDKVFAKEASGWFHEIGVPKAMAQKIAEKFNGFAAAQAAAQEVAQRQEGERQMGELKKEWGGQYDANLERGRMALKTFGISAELVSKIESQVGAAQIIKTFAQIGAAISEGTLSPGGGTSNGAAASGDPEQARAARMFQSTSKK